jgi:hypothetical protein
MPADPPQPLAEMTGEGGMSGQYRSARARPYWTTRKRYGPPGWYCCRRLMLTVDMVEGQQIRCCRACGTTIRTAGEQLLETIDPSSTLGSTQQIRSQQLTLWDLDKDP